VVVGFAGLVDGPLDAPGAKEVALDKAHSRGYLGARPLETGPDAEDGAQQ
jgi:urease subunit gamma/beta